MRHAIMKNDLLEPIVSRRIVDYRGIKHPCNILKLWSEAELNAVGIYEIVDGTFDAFEFKKTGSQLELIDGKAIETILTEPISVNELKTREKANISMNYGQVMMSRPRVDSGLGFFVDGGRTDLDNFSQKAQRMSDTDTTQVKDADNAIHDGITKAQMQQIADAIFANGEALLREKWQKQLAVDSIDGKTGTVQEVRDAIQ